MVRICQQMVKHKFDLSLIKYLKIDFKKWSLFPPGTDPEDTILAAFKLFDPNGTGFVNKEE